MSYICKSSIINYQSSIVVLLSWGLKFCLTIACVGCSGHGTSGLLFSSGSQKNFTTIRTLCLVELSNHTAYPQISGDVSASLYQAIQKKNLFDLSMLRQSDADWKNLPLNPDSPNSLEQLLAARKMLGVDAVLIGSVASFTPYPHMSMGLNLKIIDLRDGRLVWKMEQVWDTDDKATVEKIKKFFEHQMRPGFSPLDEKLAMLSSINFIKFVTYGAAETFSR
jgi:hypothetical protein